MNRKVALIIAFIVAVIIVLSVRNAESAGTPIVAHAASQRTAEGAPRLRVRPVADTKRVSPSDEMKTLLEKVPTKGSLKKTGDYDTDAHRSPEEIADITNVIGEVLDRAEQEKDFQPQALWFFDRCARKVDVLNSIGITCLFYLRKLARQTNTEIYLPNYPEKWVKKTTQQLEMLDAQTQK